MIQLKYFSFGAKKEFENTKGVIRMRKSKDGQHNGQNTKENKTNDDLQSITHKT